MGKMQANALMEIVAILIFTDVVANTLFVSTFCNYCWLINLCIILNSVLTSSAKTGN